MVGSIDAKKFNFQPTVEEKSSLGKSDPKTSKIGLVGSSNTITPQKKSYTSLRGLIAYIPLLGSLINRFIDFIASLFSSTESKTTPKKSGSDSSKETRSTPLNTEKESIDHAELLYTEAQKALDEIGPAASLKSLYRDALLIQDPTLRDERILFLKKIGLTEEDQKAIDEAKKKRDEVWQSQRTLIRDRESRLRPLRAEENLLDEELKEAGGGNPENAPDEKKLEIKEKKRWIVEERGRISKSYVEQEKELRNAKINVEKAFQNIASETTPEGLYRRALEIQDPLLRKEELDYLAKQAQSEALNRANLDERQDEASQVQPVIEGAKKTHEALLAKVKGAIQAVERTKKEYEGKKGNYEKLK